MSLGLGPSVLLAVRLLGAPAAVDWGYGARSEVSGGSIPVEVDETLAPAGEAYFELATGMLATSPTSSLTLRYLPRLFARIPGTEQYGRPLLFHSLSLAMLTRPTPRWVLGLSGSGGLGEISYSGVQAYFAPGTVPAESSTLSVVMGDAVATASYRSSRRNTLQLALRAAAQEPLYPEDPVADYRRAGATLGDAYRLSRVDTLTLSASGEYATSDELGVIAVVGVDAAYQRSLDASSTVNLQAGLATTSTPGRDPALLPSGSVSYATSWGTRVRPWAARVGGGTQGFFDPLNFTYRPIAFVGAEVTTTVDGSLHTGANLSASTALTRHPLADTPYETIIGVALPSTYELSETFELAFGARGSLFAPHSTELSEGRLQAQFLLYVGFRHHDGTRPSRGSWLN